jgi:hypothetical protein
LLGNCERNNLEILILNGRIILKCILKKRDGKLWAEFIWLRARAGGGIL